MSLINISNLTFSYDSSYDNIFENVSFKIDTNWKLGFIGRNGRGKTTFLKLLLGNHDYRGNISASVNFEYFPFNVSDTHIHTIAVIECICGDYQYWELIRELSLLGVSEEVLQRPFYTLSNGEQTKILLATLFLKENSFLLIDEPTTHLDAMARVLVGNYLKSKKGFILVSHDRDFLDSCIDHLLSVNNTNIEIQRGNFSSWFANKMQQDNFELTENIKLQRELKRLEKTAAEKSQWSDNLERTKYGTKNSGVRPDRGYIGHKAAKIMKRAKSIEARQQIAIEEKSKLLKNIESAESLKISPLAYHTSRLVSLDDIAVFYGDKVVCKNITFTINQGDRIAMCGKNGCGKSSIIKLICGEKICYTGNFQQGSGLIVSCVSQDTSFLSGNLAEFAFKNHIDHSLFKSILRKMDFSRIQFEKNIEDFSSGQKKKVLLAKSLCKKAHLYIWDEPLNYIDVVSRMQIEDLLLEFNPTILFVEHDSAFTRKVSTKQFTF